MSKTSIDYFQRLMLYLGQKPNLCAMQSIYSFSLVSWLFNHLIRKSPLSSNSSLMNRSIVKVWSCAPQVVFEDRLLDPSKERLVLRAAAVAGRQIYALNAFIVPINGLFGRKILKRKIMHLYNRWAYILGGLISEIISLLAYIQGSLNRGVHISMGIRVIYIYLYLLRIFLALIPLDRPGLQLI